jgi:hypothetical protein
MNYIFEQGQTLGKLHVEAAPVRLPRASWYVAYEVGDGLSFRFEPGFLQNFKWLSADFLLEGQELAVYYLTLHEGDGARFVLSFGLLTQCQARMRIPLEAVNQNRWMYSREGAWLKPLCWGDRVSLAQVDRMELRVERKGLRPVRYAMTPVTASQSEPTKLDKPILSGGALLDPMGQSRHRTWPGRSRSVEEVTTRLHRQLAAADQQRWPEAFSRWGGWAAKNLGGSGFFRTAKEDGRWWLVDPEGHPFWSAGLDCVLPDTGANYGGLETALEFLPVGEAKYAAAWVDAFSEADAKMINYLKINFIRAFGAEHWYNNWARIALGEMRRIGFNTVANWSDWRVAKAAGMPYVRPLDSIYQDLPAIYRDFPDVYHPDFSAVCVRYAEQLRETRDDPAFIGYFMMNEPTWGFAMLTPAEGMVLNTPQCYARQELARWLAGRYPGAGELAAVWGDGTTLEAVAGGTWTLPLTEQAKADLADFSTILVERFIGGLSAACRAVDPAHLNLGIRYYTVPPQWALAGMRAFDVFSMNCYKQRVSAEEMERISAMLDMPIMIGEWHFGALDVGLPASGIGHVPSQAERGMAYRFYVEDAAAKPWCVGVHYFILYDQSAIGRYDGENYNIGFLDVCNRPYEELCAAARASHERLYAVASAESQPFTMQPQYLPLLFM